MIEVRSSQLKEKVAAVSAANESPAVDLSQTNDRVQFFRRWIADSTGQIHHCLQGRIGIGQTHCHAWKYIEWAGKYRGKFYDGSYRNGII